METVVTEAPALSPVIKTIYERRAVRKYKDTHVKTAFIEKIIDAGRMAPSAMNKQPWRFYVVTNEETIHLFSKAIRKIAMKTFIKIGAREVIKTIVNFLHFPQGTKFLRACDHVFYEAPVVIFITAPKDNEWAALDIGMCAQNMMLTAKALGLDTCPIGFAQYIEHTSEYDKLKIPSTDKVFIAITLGYGDEQPEVHERKKDNVVFLN